MSLIGHPVTARMLSAAPPRPLISDAPPPQTGLYLGARVRHARFGEGTVTAFDGEGERARVEVAFADSGSKWLIASMARLEPL